MFIPKLTTDRVVRRLRWWVLLIILVDAASTLAGQPSSYWRAPVLWHAPRMTDEINPIDRYFLARGILPYAGMGLVYVVGSLYLASILPRVLGLTLLFFLLLEHFWGMTSWWLYRFGDGLGPHVAFELCIAVLIAISICEPKIKHD